MSKTIRFLFVAAALACAAGLTAGSWAPPAQERTPDVVYVGTPYDVVSRMLKLARVRNEDTVYDLGCGDGRMIVLAARKYGCRGVGFDIDPERIAAALQNVKANGVSELVSIVEQDIFTVDLSKADVLLLYLLPEINTKLLPQFEKMKPGSRIVTHDYDIDGIEADESFHVTSNEDNADHTLYLYTTPLKKAQ